MKLTLAGVSHHRAPIELRERVALDLDACRALAQLPAARRRGRRALDVQPHRALPRPRGARRGRGGRGAHRAGRRPGRRPRRRALPAAGRGGGAAPLPRRRPGSTRSFPARARSSARCGRRSRPARRARFSTGSSARRCTRGAASGWRRRSARARRRCRRRRQRSPSRCSASSPAAASCCSAPARSASRLRATSVSRGAEIAVVANRTLAHGEELARKLGARALALDAVAAELEHADVVVSATSAAELVLSRETVAAALRARKGRPLLLVDLAVPRDLDPAINELDGCFLYDVDDLEAVVDGDALGPPWRGGARRAARRRRGRALPRVAGLARHRPDDRVAARARRGDPRQRARRRPAAGSPRRERRHVESVTSQILAKLLHLPTIRMKEAAAAADGVVYADVVRHLFGLEEEERRR